MTSPLNPGVRALVAFLRANGFETCDSGDGVTHDYECDRDHAYVVSTVPAAKLVAEADRLIALLAAVGIEVLPAAMENTPCIQASYDPANCVAFVDLMHVTDDMLDAAEVSS